MSKNFKEQIKIIINYFNIGNFKKVLELSNNLLKHNPEDDFVLNIVGLSYQKMRDYMKAENIFTKAILINSKNINAITNIANNYKYILKYKLSEDFYKKALEIDPNHTIALINYGNLKFLISQYEEALHLLKRAENINNKLIPVQVNLAIIYQSLGNFTAAIKCLDKINELDPTFTRADKMKSLLIDYDEKSEHLKEMKLKLKNLKLTDAQKIYLLFAISKANEDLSNYPKAHQYMKEGNDLKFQNSNYNINQEIDKTEKIKKIFSNLNFKNFEEDKYKITPIFIIGLPRSGTSLVEQIISAHNDVEGLGELNIFNNIANNEFLNKKIYNSLNLNLVDFSEVRKKYLEIIDCFNLKKNFFTDKTLLNFNWIGVVKRCFPNSKIIHCTRNPKDNLLSIYKNLFDHEGDWCYNENSLIQYYKNYLDIMNFWNQLIKNKIFTLKYEELIQDPETNIKNLLEYCNLNWDENCLNFNNNKTGINTLSVKQARNSIYKTSVNSFKNYTDLNKDLFKGL